MPLAEVFRVVHIAGDEAVLDVAEYSSGDADRVGVPVDRIMADAVRLGSRALVVSHNHPDGDVRPSATDRITTRRLVAAAAALGIRVHDAIVTGNAQVFSFREAGLL